MAQDRIFVTTSDPGAGRENSYDSLAESIVKASVVQGWGRGTHKMVPGKRIMNLVATQILRKLREQYDEVLNVRSGAFRGQIKRDNMEITENSVTFRFPGTKHPNATITFAQLAQIQKANNGRDFQIFDTDEIRQAVADVLTERFGVEDARRIDNETKPIQNTRISKDEQYRRGGM